METKRKHFNLDTILMSFQVYKYNLSYLFSMGFTDDCTHNYFGFFVMRCRLVKIIETISEKSDQF